MPDLSGAFGRQLDAAIAKAKKLEAAGDAQGARRAYLKASELAFNYAKYAPGNAIKKQRIERAKKLKAKADAVARQRVQAAEPKAPSAAQGGDEGIGADREAVRRLITKSAVTWDDIAGLEDVKRELRTAYAMAVAKAPVGVELTPSRTILLYGPPGTGKTLLAQAVSKSLDATFFNVRTGDLLSSLFGKSPQLIAAIFEEAEANPPSVIFFDEIEALVPTRDGLISPAEGRVVTAFLQSLGGFASKAEAGFVLTIAATNQPWRLDQAMLSRFARRIHVPLPDAECRARILELNLHDRGIECELDIRALANFTEGYSGREIRDICQAAINAAIHESNPDLEEQVDRGRDALASYELKLDRISAGHFRSALAKIKPVADEHTLQRYAEWATQQA